MFNALRVFLFVALAGSAAAGATASRATTTTRIASGLQYPIFLTSPPNDSRLFIVLQRGYIRIIKDGQLLARPFLNIDSLVPDISGNDERGFLGLAFDPNYAQNGRFYVNYINLSGDTVIARYLVSGDPDVADSTSAAIILTIDQPFANHNGGTLAFGPGDGYLYIGMGDGGGAGDTGNRAQNPLELLGKMLRIDVSSGSGYTIPPNNPFYNDPNYRGEIWALGVRNPYRWGFDRLTYDLYIADVGQYDWEEIDFQPAGDPGGQNYGWRLMEGMHCFDPPTNCDDGDPPLTYPIHEYPHDPECSVTGGYVYRGSAIPALQGHYFFADYCSARIWSFRYDGQNLTEFTDRTAELAPGGGLAINSIAGFGEDYQGELYIADRGNGSSGEIYKIVPDVSAAPGPNGGARALGLGPARPNPSSGSVRFDVTSAQLGRVEIEVVDAAGRTVRRLAGGPESSGSAIVSWDGLDESGRPAATGVYFIRARHAGAEATSRISIVR